MGNGNSDCDEHGMAFVREVGGQKQYGTYKIWICQPSLMLINAKSSAALSVTSLQWQCSLVATVVCMTRLAAAYQGDASQAMASTLSAATRSLRAAL